MRSVLISLRRCLHRLVLIVLKIWSFELKICFGFRNSGFEFINRLLALTATVETFRDYRLKWLLNAEFIGKHAPESICPDDQGHAQFLP